MSATVSYQGNTQTITNNPFILKTANKYCENDIIINYTGGNNDQNGKVKTWTVEIPERPQDPFITLIPSSDEWLSENIWKDKNNLELNDGLTIMLFPIQFKEGETQGDLDCSFTIKSQSTMFLNSKSFTLVGPNHTRLNRDDKFNEGQSYELYIPTNPENENIGALQYISFTAFTPGTYKIIAFIQE